MDSSIVAPIAGFSAMAFAGYLASRILKHETGTARMKEIYDAILVGAVAYLNRQYKTAIAFVVTLAIITAYFLGFFTAFALIMGALFGTASAHIGMNVAVRANVRTAQAARSSLNNALRIAFHGGAITGLSVLGLVVLGLSGLYFISGDPVKIVGFGFGASITALFARVGGGIYTKAADVGADLVGKVEVGIPEDDPRNPAVIADNVGDNVGDVAGMGADLFQSYACAMIASMIVGQITYGLKGIIFPLLMGAVGIFATILGTFFVRMKNEENPLIALNKGIFVTGISSIIAFYFLAQQVIGTLDVFYAMLSGIVAAILISLATQHYTSYHRRPVQAIARAAQAGPAINIITGLATGLRTTAPAIIIISAAILVSYKCADLYGILITVIGMHAATGMIIAIDSYGPITDNASGIVEMSGLGPEVREITDKLDSAGNTTKTICKVIAITDAALAELALFTAFFKEAGLEIISITNPYVVVGLFIGGALPFVLCSFCLQAVGKATFEMVEEVRRQFREIPGLVEGLAKPDYSRCVDISTRTALREMIAPVILAVISPLLMGFVFGPETLGGLLAGSITSSILLAVFMANTGSAWDNAKKYIEAGYLGGKGTTAHAAAVIGDTVGDPLKDTAGPSLNALVKSMNTISLLFAEYFLAYAILM